MSNSKQYAKYYFFYFAALGLISPFLGVWLESIYKNKMSIVMTAFQSTMIIAPIVWGHMAGGSKNPIKWLSAGTLGAVIFAGGLITVKEGVPPEAAMFLLAAFGVFFTPLLPHLESIVYKDGGGDQGAYAKIRLSGSIGFMLVSVALGSVVIKRPELFPWMVFGFLTLAWLVSLPGQYYTNINKEPDTSFNVCENEKVKLRDIWPKLKSLWVFWLVVIAVQIGFAGYFVYFALHLKSLGYSGEVIGGLIGVSIAAEVIAFMTMGKFIDKLPPWLWIVVGMFLTSLRWLLIKNAGDVGIAGLVMAQATNAIGYSVVHASCLKILFDKCGSSGAGLSQSIYNSLSYGVGGVIGVSFAGLMWASGGGAYVFDGAFYMALMTGIISVSYYYFFVRKK